MGGGRYVKVDNAGFWEKIALRRYFLSKYHADGPFRVFDACCGTQKIWTQLRSEFAVEQYWGVDLKPAPGRVAIDSARLLHSRELVANYDVIDIDTYGSPWTHWKNLLPNVSGPLTVFLTLGGTRANFTVSQDELTALGIVFSRPIPETLRGRMAEILALENLLRISARYAKVIESAEAEHDGGAARYFGVHLDIL
jgi:hypothetical protein